MDYRRTTYYSCAITAAAALALGCVGQMALGQPPVGNGIQLAHPEAGAADSSQSTPSSPVRQASAEEPISASAVGAGAPDAKKGNAPAIAPISDAKRITQLERATEDGQKRLIQLKKRLSDSQADYTHAETEFKQLDSLLEESRRKLQKITAEGTEADIAKAKQAALDVEPRWNRAKQRFDVELQERRTLNDNIKIIEQKLQSDREASEKLNGAGQETETSAGATVAPQNATAAAPGASTPVAAAPRDVPAAEPKELNESVSASNAALPLPTMVPSVAPTDATKNASVTAPAAPEVSKTKKAPSKELVEATQIAEKSAAEAIAAENEARSITERISLLKKSIQMERELRDAERKKVDIAEETLESLDAELSLKKDKHEDLKQLQVRVSETKRQLAESREETRRVTTQLDKLQSELSSLQAEQLAAFEQAEKKRTLAEEAQQKVKHLNNPFTAQFDPVVARPWAEDFVDLPSDGGSIVGIAYDAVAVGAVDGGAWPARKA